MDDLETMLRTGRTEEALGLAEAAAERHPTAGALRDLARARIRAQQPLAAVAAAERGLRADRDSLHGPELLTLLADAYERLGELQRADELCTRALGLFLDGGENNFIGVNARTRFPILVRCRVAVARVSERRGQLLRAAYLLEGVQIHAHAALNPELCPSPEDAPQNASFWNEIAHLIHLHRGRVALALDDMTLAETELKAALSAALTQSDAEAIVLTHVELGRLAARQQHPDAAQRHFLEGVQWHETGQATVRDDELRAAVRSSREELYAGAIESAFAAQDFLAACQLSEQARARVFLARIGGGDAPAVPDWFPHRGEAPWPLEPDTGILEFFLADTSLYSFLFTSDSARIADLPVPTAVLNRRVTRLRELIENPDADSGELAVREEQVYRWLIEPHEETIDQLNRLVIVPYGVLAYLPFAMLGGDRPLVDRVELSYAPSAAVLDRLLTEPPAVVRTATVFGDPHPDDDLLAMPHASAEAQRVAGLIGVEPALGPAATTTAFRAALSGHDLLHVACHAWFDQHDPRRSALLFADPTDARRPNRVNVGELYDGHTDARLVVLSGCQTGLADLTAGGELDGLVRAFLTAGVRTVLGSLWRVDDEATSALMSAFYTGLGKDMGPAAALRCAQRSVKDNPSSDHPYSWAGFGSYGDWRTRGAFRPNS
jgi:CHAT domain-containing protein